VKGPIKILETDVLRTDGNRTEIFYALHSNAIMILYASE